MKNKKDKAAACCTKTKGKKLSKLALWWQKHPNGLEGKILDMRAVMK
jgi:hypothetical protein